MGNSYWSTDERVYDCGSGKRVILISSVPAPQGRDCHCPDAFSCPERLGWRFCVSPLTIHLPRFQKETHTALSLMMDER